MFGKTGVNVGNYINSLLSITHPNLHVIEIYGEKLYRYDNDDEVAKRGQHVSRLELNKTDIDEKCLGSSLTKEFPKLDHLRLHDWNIGGSTEDEGDDGSDREEEENNKVQILMPETSLDLLYIANSDFLNRPMLLISVSSVDQNITKYYIDANARDKATEISQKTFDAFKANLKDEDMTLLSVTAKSVKKVQLWTYVTATKLYRNIKLEIF